MMMMMMMMDGLVSAWMNAVNRWMDEQVMIDEMGLKNRDSNHCFVRHAWWKIHLQPFHLTESEHTHKEALG